jgi:hypothetical protein
LSHSETGTSYKRPKSAQQSAPAGVGENRSPRTFKAEDFPIPPELDTPAFREAWREWSEFRRTAKRKPITEHAARLQMDQLRRAGPDAAVSAIREAIANDWQGLFPRLNQGTPNERKTQWAESKWQRAFGPAEPTNEDP